MSFFTIQVRQIDGSGNFPRQKTFEKLYNKFKSSYKKKNRKKNRHKSYVIF